MMAYSKINSRGQTYWLHSREGKGGAKLFFFSKSAEGAVDLLDIYEVFENPRTGLPMVRKKK